MKKILLIAIAVFTVAGLQAQKLGKAKTAGKTEASSDAGFGVADVDNYINNVNAVKAKSDKVKADLTQLETDVNDAGTAATADQVADFVARKDAAKAALESIGSDAEALSKESEKAIKAAPDCGLKVGKCTKAVKNATASLGEVTKGVTADLKRAATLEGKIEALNAAH